jgi:ABC-type bacteriocin/lantibiotic exporter with double-glycine peptidase domain
MAKAEAIGNRRGGTPAAATSNVFAFAWRESHRHQPWLGLLALSIFPLTMAPLELQRRMVDQAIGGQELELLLWLGAAYLAVVLLQGVLKYALHVWRSMVSERTILNLRRALHEHGRGETGETVSMVASEVERVGGFIGEAFSEPVLQGGVLIAVFGYMLVVEPTIALISLCFFVPQAVLVPPIQRVINRRARRKVKLVRELGDQIVESQSGAPDVYDDTTSKVYRVRMSYFRLKFLVKFLSNLINHLGPLSVLVVGGYLAINGETTLGTIVAFISGFERMAEPSRQMVAYYHLASETQVQYRLLAQQIS